MIFLYILCSIPLFISLYNLYKLPTLKSSSKRYSELVSIVIPARNEKDNIGKCLKALQSQEYKDIEIIVVDDNSTDSTYKIAKSYKGVTVVKGSELKKGWMGKNWAMQQGSILAKGKYLLFIDADVRIGEYTILDSVNTLENSDVSLLSIFPNQISKSFLAKLNIHNMSWLILSFLPVDLIYRSPLPQFMAVIGQYMFVKRSTFVDIKGYSKIKGEKLDDIKMGMLVKKSGYRVMAVFDNSDLSTNMYNSLKDSILGLSRAFYGNFNNTPIIFFATLIITSAIYLLPIILTIIDINNYPLIMLNILNYINVALVSNVSIFYAILYPIQFILFLITGITSYINFKRDNVIWKGRKI